MLLASLFVAWLDEWIFCNMQDDSKIKDLFVFFASSKFNHAFREHLHFLAAQCNVSPARLLSKFFTDEGTLYCFPVAWCTPYLYWDNTVVCNQNIQFLFKCWDLTSYINSTFKWIICLTTNLSFMLLFFSRWRVL